MSPPDRFSIAWEAGASAQIELFSPGAGAAGKAYRLKYTPPFRATIRPPLADLKLGKGEIDFIKNRLNQLVVTVNARGAPGAQPAPSDDAVLNMAREVGGQLFDMVIPDDVSRELRRGDLFLEVGADEVHLQYPWELLYDGEEFLCLKHFVGRFVNVARTGVAQQRFPELLEPDALSVLLISVPRPQPRDNVEYAPLVEAEAETNAIRDTLMPLGESVKIKLLSGKDATFNAVWKAIKSPPRYHIVHFNGHAYFNNEDPHLSSLVLFDQNMTTGPIVNFFGNRPPVLLVMNACETAASQGVSADWKDRYDIFGLARAFLETGAYLIGTRWKVGDKAASEFAKKFYSGLVEGLALGKAVRDARIACKANTPPDDFSWASYLFYGDPRLCFRKLP